MNNPALWTPAQRSQLREIARKFQDEKPTIAELLASGEYSGPMPLGEHIDEIAARPTSWVTRFSTSDFMEGVE